MRRLSLIAVALLVALTVAGNSASGHLRPSLSLRGTAPIVVDGGHFQRHERVRITSSTGALVTVRASSAGTFRARLSGVPVDRCSGLIVRARGSAGSVAVARKLPLPECLPARTQGGQA